MAAMVEMAVMDSEVTDSEVTEGTMEDISGMVRDGGVHTIRIILITRTIIWLRQLSHRSSQTFTPNRPNQWNIITGIFVSIQRATILM